MLEQALGQQQRLQQSQDHEIEVKQLRETLQEYNAEFAHVKNQECTIQKLREQLKELEDRIEGRAAVSGMREGWGRGGEEELGGGGGGRLLVLLCRLK